MSLIESKNFRLIFHQTKTERGQLSSDPVKSIEYGGRCPGRMAKCSLLSSPSFQPSFPGSEMFYVFWKESLLLVGPTARLDLSSV